MIRWGLGLLIVALSGALNAQIWLEQTRIDTSTVITGIEIPWDLEWWGDDTLLFTQIDGTIHRLAVNTSQLEEIYTVPNLARENQSGLMGMQMHPMWPDTSKFYVAYTFYHGAEIKLRIEELIYDRSNDQVTAGSAILDSVPVTNSNLGCRLLIAEDNTMYVTMGDIKDSEAPQDPNSLSGKVLRMNLDGSAPSDNPTSGTLVYSLGHRNPQGITQVSSGKVYISEHGPFTDDEFNLLEAGGNFGWPLVTGPCGESNQSLCDSIGAIDPMLDWTPTIAPCGIEFYDNPAIPEWENSILMATLKDEQLHVLHFEDQNQDGFSSTSTHLKFVFGRLRDVLVAPNGEVYLATTNKDVFGTPGPRDDRIIRLTPSQHNGIGEDGFEELSVRYLDEQLVFNGPVEGTLTITDLLGRELLSREMKGRQSIPFQTTEHLTVLLVNLHQEDQSFNQKLILR